MMTDLDVLVKAGAILTKHGALTSDYIIDQLGDVLDGLCCITHRNHEGRFT